jgi:hypothetical protein
MKMEKKGTKRGQIYFFTTVRRVGFAHHPVTSPFLKGGMRGIINCQVYLASPSSLNSDFKSPLAPLF